MVDRSHVAAVGVDVAAAALDVAGLEVFQHTRESAGNPFPLPGAAKLGAS